MRVPIFSKNHSHWQERSHVELYLELSQVKLIYSKNMPFWASTLQNFWLGSLTSFSFVEGILLSYTVHNIFTARKRSLGQGNIFRSVCQEFCSQGGGAIPACLAAGGVLSQRPLQTATAAGGTYPTGMHSCSHYVWLVFPASQNSITWNYWKLQTKRR